MKKIFLFLIMVCVGSAAFAATCTESSVGLLTEDGTGTSSPAFIIDLTSNCAPSCAPMNSMTISNFASLANTTLGQSDQCNTWYLFDITFQPGGSTLTGVCDAGAGIAIPAGSTSIEVVMYDCCGDGAADNNVELTVGVTYDYDETGCPIYWLSNPAPAGAFGTCADAVLVDPSGIAYDSGGPNGSPTVEEQVVHSFCPQGAGTVTFTVDYDLGTSTLQLYDGPSRDNEDNGSPTEITPALTGTGTFTFTTSGPCFSVYEALFVGNQNDFQINWSVATAGPGFTFVQGDMCDNPYVITAANTPLAMNSTDATSGPAYLNGVIVNGVGCEPDLLTAGCTSTIENTINASFQSCAAGGPATLTLAGANCTPGGESPQMFLYTGSCGAFTYVDCAASVAAGNNVTLNATLDPNTEYLIVIDGFRGNECTFDLGITGCLFVTPPANDECANATPLDCNVTLTGETSVNSTDNGDALGCVPSAINLGNAGSGVGVWYTFTATATEDILVSAANASFDHKLVVASGASCAGPFTNIDCADGFTGGTESMTISAVEGTTYYAYVGDFDDTGTATGTFDMSISGLGCEAPACVPEAGTIAAP